MAGLAWMFLYLKDMHPLGSLGAKLDNDQLSGLAIRFNNAKLVGRSEGEKVWELEAKSIELSRDRRLTTFKGVARGSLIQDGEKIASISADEVTYNTFTRNVMAPGVAELKLEKGPSFKVHKIYWNAKKSKLYCEDGVEAVLDGSTIQGDRMIADLENKELEIHKVRGSIRLDDEDLL